MAEPAVERSFEQPNLELTCHCGWHGLDADVDSWTIDRDRDRAIRNCPSCGEPVPEWGTLPSLEGARGIARGALAEALAVDDDAEN